MLKDHIEIPELPLISVKLVYRKGFGNVLYIGTPDSISGDAEYINDFKVYKIVHTYGSI